VTDRVPDKLPYRLPDIDPSQAGIDRLLRRSLSAPVPTLPSGFDQRLRRELSQSPGQNAPALDRYRHLLLTAYGVTSGLVSAVVMHSQGLAWTAVAAMILGPVALTAAIPLARRATHTSR
jgi:hypothetical protein